MISALVLDRKTEVSAEYIRPYHDILRGWFEPVFVYSVHHKKIVLSTALAVHPAGLFLFTRLGGEFILRLEEGDLASDIMTLQGLADQYRRDR